jgi:predicted transposase/invertase (TIGR01784 family)
MGIIFVYLGNSKVKDQLINLLDLMFKSSKNASEKITTLHNDFGIDLTQEGEGDLAVMCNLGEGIYEDGLMKGKQEGWEKGRKEGREEGRREGKLEFALELLKDGMALEKVAKYSKLSLSMIQELAKQNKLI